MSWNITADPRCSVSGAAASEIGPGTGTNHRSTAKPVSFTSRTVLTPTSFRVTSQLP